ncbi:Protein of unknown function [Pyronema omphalodes CBS 100304]|uniref:Uncharacterized protein n=1 Tax=Pyronema omphalodes (strain CBS 100304) TaxID=1076935 RepID=U4L868_PYROM|nr:Protein of unknown function [Pyronema omphalodes CBS 100304]
MDKIKKEFHLEALAYTGLYDLNFDRLTRFATVAPKEDALASPRSQTYNTFLDFFAQHRAHFDNNVDAALTAFATRYEVNVAVYDNGAPAMPATPAILDAPAAPAALDVAATTNAQVIPDLEAPAGRMLLVTLPAPSRHGAMMLS